MMNTNLDFDTGLAGLSGPAWIDQLEDVTDDLGFFEPLGPEHQVVHLSAGPRLLVTFEDADTICRGAEAEPRSFEFARSLGWSVLTVISNHESWFRHQAIYQFFDRLTDDGFFDAYEQVLFYGAGGAGYAACAYSVAAPGARVLAIRPQATLDPRVTGWDSRFYHQRKHSFTDRYGYAPDMLDAADEAYVVFSPVSKADAIHAAIFTRKNVVCLRVPGTPGRLETSLDQARLIDDLIEAAMAGRVTPARFARLMHAVKDLPGYQRALFKRALDAGHVTLAAKVAAYVLRKRDDPFFQQKLEQLAERGIRPAAVRAVSAAE